MDSSRRKFFAMSAGTGLVAGLGVSIPRTAQAIPVNNQIIVGVGGDFTDIDSALSSITDNSRTNPYQILLLPGTYGGFDTKPYVDIVGSGVKSSIIETGFLFGDYIRLGSYVSLSNMGIKYSGTTGSSTIRGAVQKLSDTQSEVIMSNIEFEVYDIAGVIAPKYA